MTPKPPLPRREPHQSAMTIGIATHYSDGLILCSDRKIVEPTGLTTTRTKQSLSAFSSQHLFGVSFAGDDVAAAEMLSKDIVSAAGDVGRPQDFDRTIKATMREWFQSYGAVRPPTLQFIVAHVDVKNKRGEILRCEPPSTITRPTGLVTIGSGGDVVAHYSDLLFPLPSSPVRYYSLRTALLRLAYLMKLANERDGAYVGGKTDVVIISEIGSFTFLEREEMARAEEFAVEADSVIHKMCSQILSDSSDAESEITADELSKAYAKLHGHREQLKFSTGPLNNSIWKNRGPKKLASQT
jgi:20S proteasome alpha/beta subunit